MLHVLREHGDAGCVAPIYLASVLSFGSLHDSANLLLQEKGGRAPVHESKINSMCAANRASLEVGQELIFLEHGRIMVGLLDSKKIYEER